MLLEMREEEIIKIIEEKGVKWINLQFMDLLGKLYNLTVSSKTLTLDSFKTGLGKLDGSSVKGFKSIEESDLVLKPVPETFAIIPWDQSCRMFCRIYNTFGGGRLLKDPRLIAEKTVEHLKKLNLKCFLGPEVEFFIFNRVEAYHSNEGCGYRIYSDEGPWNGKEPSIGFKEGYMSTPPKDRVYMARKEIAEILERNFRVTVEAHHHEVATSGQIEINMKFKGLVEMSDEVVSLKYVAKQVAGKLGMIATFIPKPIPGDNASGMHVHQSLWRNDLNIFYDDSDEYAELSQVGRYYIGGLIEHGRALSAIVSPTVNSYKRLIPGYEAPVYLIWSRANRSAAIRVPVYLKKDKSKRVEYRPPDPSANPYLAFSAMILAGLDGVKKKIDPGDPIDENIYLMKPSKRRALGIKQLPRDLWEALDELESDMEFLKPVFNQDLIETYIELKRKEFLEVNTKPTPIEIIKYIDA